MTAERGERTDLYAAYGLTIRSAIPLDEFASATGGREDVVVSYGATSAESADRERRSRSVEINGAKAEFRFDDVGRFVVQDGSRILAYPHVGIEASYLRLYVQGMLMAMLLHQRGACVLHASVVEIDGRSIALAGHIGAGKSSLAAALYARGHCVLADDNASIVDAAGALAVTPAYPYVKLYPTIASLLGFHNGALRLLHTSQTKIAGEVGRRFAAKPSPLGAIYVLGREHPQQIRRLSALEATVELIRNAVPTRWGHAGDGGHLGRCAQVAKRIPVFALRTFNDLDALREVATDLEGHWREQRGSTESVE